jgi:redox-sensitive bicupin YhaK (pirin superfamily)
MATVHEPRVLDPATAPWREVRRRTSAPSGLEGEGFPVKRAFAGVPLEELDPFIHLDEMGRVDYGPGEPKGTPWHPHRGFETVTYLLDGAFEHQDSMGGGGALAPGDVQWMTAGRGILHIERPPERLVVSGGVFHGFQLWVNLPRVLKWAPPRYQDVRGGELGIGHTADGGALVKVVAGTLGGVEGPAATHWPVTVAHVLAEQGAQARIPVAGLRTCLVYVFEGMALLGQEATEVGPSQLAVLGEGAGLVMTAPRGRVQALVLAGQPIGEPIAWYGPFVMNTRAELRQAFEDYQAGRLGVEPVAHVQASELAVGVAPNPREDPGVSR